MAALVVAAMAVVGTAWGGPGHNDPGPGNCGHTHGGLNTSVCTAEGAACTTSAGTAGTCQTTRQQCYCLETKTDGGVKPKDAGVMEPEPIDQVLGRR